MGETRLSRFWKWMAPNAVWDGVKYLGGTTMLSGFGHLCWLEFHRTPVDWWWLGSLMVGGGVMITIAKRNDHSREFQVPTPVLLQPLISTSSTAIADPRWKGFATESELRDAERHAQVEAVGERLVDVFTPLQIEAIRLAHDLGAFMEEIGKRPDSPDGATKHEILQHAITGEGGKWVVRMQAKYESDYSPRVNRFISLLERESGRLNVRLRQYKDHVHVLGRVHTMG